MANKNYRTTYTATDFNLLKLSCFEFNYSRTAVFSNTFTTRLKEVSRETVPIYFYLPNENKHPLFPRSDKQTTCLNNYVSKSKFEEVIFELFDLLLLRIIIP